MKKDLSMQRFGKLQVMEYMYSKDGHTYWLCKCDCGNEVIRRSDHLITGRSKSCGCLRKEMLRQRKTTHGKTHTRLYNIWSGMKRRCINSNDKRYEDYGGRGITVCDEWKDDFQAFHDWAMENGYEEHLTIDRINNDGNYEPSNCRWATYQQQNKNYSRNRLITFEGRTQTVEQWAKEKDIAYSALYQRLFIYKWEIEEAFSKPIRGEKSG